MSFSPTLANSLPNGAKILSRKQKDDGVWVWLAYWKGHAFPYVTWISSPTSPGETFWGHYFSTATVAIHDYVKR